MRKKAITNIGVTTLLLGGLFVVVTNEKIETVPLKVSELRGSIFADLQMSDDSKEALTIGYSESVVASSQAVQSPDLDMLTTGSVNSSFFRTSAVSFSNLGAQKDWNRVRSAVYSERNRSCKTTRCEKRFANATNVVSGMKKKSFFDKLQSVNKFVNSNVQYNSDLEIYGKRDYWASARQTIEQGRGDCEDFAILKHAMLLKAGIPASSLSLIVLKDTSRNLYHAVLAVSTNKGHLILDNVADDVYRDTSISHYKPIFSFSQDRSWIHGVDRNSSNLLAQNTIALGSISPGESAFEEASLPDFDFAWTQGLRPSLSFGQETVQNWLY